MAVPEWRTLHLINFTNDKAVNDMYGHIVKKRGCEMLMWADRFIDGENYDLGKWEASQNGTEPSVHTWAHLHDLGRTRG